MKRVIKGIVVVAVAVLLTTFGIDAADTLQNKDGTLLANLLSSNESECPDGMVPIVVETHKLCVDAFESSPGENCPVQTVTNAIDSRSNTENLLCSPSSAEGVAPWAYVSYHQARELCAKAGKRLPTSAEWYSIALGTPDPKDGSPCNIASDKPVSGVYDSQCKNPYGVYNAVGNVWEWVDGVVVGGSYNGRQLPDSGYVVSADQEGVATLTNPDAPNQDLHDDYFWSERERDYGLLRGGFYGSRTDGGLYSIQAKTPLSLASAAIGFRCVADR